MAELWLYTGGQWRRRTRVVSQTNAVVVTYPTPAGAPSAGGWEVRVGGQATWVHPTSMGRLATYSTDAAGPVAVEVITPTTVTSAAVRPNRYGIPCTISGRAVQFTLPAGFRGHVSVETNGTAEPLFLSALPLETDVPSASQVTRYFGPGFHADVGEVVLTSGQTCYIAGGALLEGKVRIGAGGRTGTPATGARLFGRGIIDSTTLADPGRPLRLQLARSSTVSGVGVVGVVHWAIAVYESSDCLIEWVRVVNNKNTSGVGTPDGIDVIGSQRITTQDYFVRSYDDCHAIKCSKNGWYGVIEDITYQRGVLWNGLGGNGMDVGYENASGFHMHRIKHRQLDVIRKTARTDPYRRAGIGLHATGPSPIDDVLWEDVNVESAQENAVWMASFYSSDYPYPDRAPVSNLVMRRVTLPGGVPIYVSGGSAAVPINGLRWEQCTRGGAPISSASGMTVSNVVNHTFAP